MLLYGLLFVTLAMVTHLLFKGLEVKGTGSRVLFQLLPMTFILLLEMPLQSVRHIPAPIAPEQSIAGLVLAVTAGYALVVTGILTVTGIVRGVKGKDRRLLWTSAFLLVSLVFMTITHPAYQLLVLFLLGAKAVEQWKRNKRESVN